MSTGQDQRREPRRRATGRVQVKFRDPQPHEIAGKLMDVSPSGFRMKHECTSLRSGQVVEFQHLEATGKAQVVWNRILAGGVETGFFVVSE
ncbi:MAG TPA: PilZ domain-containing protein [Bryobacteraceae bacterium]|nr:PilZ domain-containing protein [Bryobacteraceae bacterium]